MSEPIGAVYVTKITAASRQLNAAIRLFFMEEDELAVHTIASAAFRVLRDVSKRRGRNFTEDVLRNGIFSIALQYVEDRMSPDQRKMVESSGLIRSLEGLLPDIKKEGAAFDRKRIRVGMSGVGEQRAWPSKATNFLKHADRDADDHLRPDELKNEHVLMGASAAYLHLMREPTPEIKAYFAFWAAKNDAVGDVAGDISMFAGQLAGMSEADRFKACCGYIADQKK